MTKSPNNLNTQLKLCVDEIIRIGFDVRYNSEKYADIMRRLDFVKYMKSFEECVENAMKRDVDLRLALIEWYKLITYKKVVELFQEADSELARTVSYDENKSYINNVEINGVPFHIRLVDFKSIFGKDEQMCDYRNPENKKDALWYLLRNDNSFIRNVLAKKHGCTESQINNMPEYLNVIYIICDEYCWTENLKLKSNFSLIKQCIAERFQRYRDENNGDVDCYLYNDQEFYSDIIFLKKY